VPCSLLPQALSRLEQQGGRGPLESEAQVEADRLARRAAAGRAAWLSALRGQGLGLLASLLVFFATLTVAPVDGLRMTLADGPKLLSEVLFCAPLDTGLNHSRQYHTVFNNHTVHCSLFTVYTASSPALSPEGLRAQCVTVPSPCSPQVLTGEVCLSSPFSFLSD